MPLHRQGRAQFIHRYGLRFEAEVLVGVGPGPIRLICALLGGTYGVSRPTPFLQHYYPSGTNARKVPTRQSDHRDSQRYRDAATSRRRNAAGSPSLVATCLKLETAVGFPRYPLPCQPGAVVSGLGLWRSSRGVWLRDLVVV
jgi:hypothetical protein